jgi:hypothetical protein
MCSNSWAIFAWRTTYWDRYRYGAWDGCFASFPTNCATMMLRIVIVCMLFARSTACEHNGDRANGKMRGDDKGHQRRYLRRRTGRITWQTSLWRFVQPNNAAKNASPLKNEDSVTLSSSRAGTRIVQPSWVSSGSVTNRSKQVTERGDGGADAEDSSFGNNSTDNEPIKYWFVWAAPESSSGKSSQESPTVDTSSDVALPFEHDSWNLNHENGTVTEHRNNSSNGEDKVTLIVSVTSMASSVENQAGASDNESEEDTLTQRTEQANMNLTSTIDIRNVG